MPTVQLLMEKNVPFAVHLYFVVVGE